MVNKPAIDDEDWDALGQERTEYVRRLMDVADLATAITGLPGDRFGKRIAQGVLDVQRGHRSTTDVCRELELDETEWDCYNNMVQLSVLRYLTERDDAWQIGKTCAEIGKLHRGQQTTREAGWASKGLDWLDTLKADLRPEDSWWFECVQTRLATFAAMVLKRHEGLDLDSSEGD